MSDLWTALEKIEQRDGHPTLFKHLLSESFRDDDPLTGNWFWYSRYAEVTKLITNTGVNQFDQDGFMRDVGRPGGWNRLWQPRTLVWANKRALELVGDYRPRAVQIPVVASTIRAFNATAIKDGTLEFIALNLPLIIGLVAANMVLLDAIERGTEIGLRLAVPELLWPRRLKKKLKELLERHHSIMLWLNNPSPTLPFAFSEELVRPGHNLAHVQMLFILLHELAHFKAGHMAVEAATPSSGPKEPVYLWPMNWDQEFEADEVAMDWLLALSAGTVSDGIRIEHGNANDVLGYAITFLFYCFATMEGLKMVGHDYRFGSHPPALLRWAKLCKKFPADQQKYQSRILALLGQTT